MNILRKTAALAAAIFILSYIQVAAYSDISGNNKYYNDIEKITAFGIMNGYPDGRFYPEKQVSRAEAAVIFAGILNLQDDSPHNSFIDVPSDYRFKGSIEAVASLGIINGTGNGYFMPEKGLSKMQAAVIMLNVMGYKDEAYYEGGYPEGYIKLAYNKNLFKRVNGNFEDSITRAEMAAMISDALDEPIMSRGFGGRISADKTVTFLTGILNIGYVKGRVEGNDKTMLTSAVPLGKNKVQVGGEIYNIGGTRADEEIGKNITLYYKEESSGEKTAVYYELQNGYKQFLLEADQIEAFENDRISYRDKSGRIKYINISKTPDVIFNGRYKAAQKEDFMPNCGQIDLYDSDGDGKYDIINILSYVTYIVSGISAGDGIIYDKYGKPPLDLSENAYKRVSIEGAYGKLFFKDIKEGDVLSVAANDVMYNEDRYYIKSSSELYSIKLSRTLKSGTAAALSEDEITIDDKKFKISDAYSYAVKQGTAVAVKPGESGDFYIDCFGFFCGKASEGAYTASGNYALALLCYEAEDKAHVEIKAYDFDLKDITELKCSDKVRIDGTVYSKSSDILRALCTQYNGEKTVKFVPRVMVYRKNGENEISRIDTDYVSEKENENNSLFYNNNQLARMYGGGCFGGDIAVSDKSMILAVPRIRASGEMTFPGSGRTFIADTSMKDYIYFRKASAFTAGSTKYTTETYNIKDSGEAELIIYYYTPAKSDTVINYQRIQTMMVEKVLRTCTDGDFGYEIRGVCGDNIIILFLSDELSVTADVKMRENESIAVPISADMLKRGDIIRYSDVRQNTNITLRAERIFSPYEESEFAAGYYCQKDALSTIEKIPYFCAFNAAYGGIKAAENNIIRLDFTGAADSEEGYSYNISGVKITLYNGDEIKTAAASELPSYKNSYNTEAAAHIFAVTQNGTIKAIYAYNFG